MHEYIENYDDIASEESLFKIPLRKDFFLRAIGRGKRVLDVGCLGGQLTELIRLQNNDVVGIEANEKAAQLARSRGIEVQVVNVEDGIPFSGASFDAVNACEVVEHLYDTKHFFAEVSRVLRPNGIFVFTTPNLNSLENRLRVVSGNYLGMIGAYPEDHFGGHVRVFNLQKIEELCEQTGLEIEKTNGIPALSSHGRVWDRSMKIAGQVLPSLSKILMIKARKKK
jgi:2-polyprenyl-6-hydroxyphenyl methylase/3-demethylubiquinone-9 3-methyltransferase